jgi:hypothetical protein
MVGGEFQQTNANFTIPAKFEDRPPRANGDAKHHSRLRLRGLQAQAYCAALNS